MKNEKCALRASDNSPVVCVFQFDRLILYPSYYFDEFLKHMMMYKKGLKRTVFVSSF